MTNSAWLRVVFVVLLSTGAASPTAVQQEAPPRRAIPVEPIGAILDAFRSHSVVGLSETHGNEQGHAFRLSLIRDPRFAATVNDIVVEFGNARYQELMDRFLRGDDLSDDALRHVWQDTTAISGVWDRPIYEEFFRAVRAVNASLPRDRQLRVLLGDLPLDWDEVRRGAEGPMTERQGQVRVFGIWVNRSEASAMDRNRHAAEVVRREVLAKQRRALVIYGGMHLFRGGKTIVALLESMGGAKVFNITDATATSFDSLNEVQPEVASWPVPSLAMVSGTALTLKEFSYFDAVLYLGPPAAMTVSRLRPALCSDAGYIEMRRQRMAWYGLPQAEADQVLERDCPKVASK